MIAIGRYLEVLGHSCIPIACTLISHAHPASISYFVPCERMATVAPLNNSSDIATVSSQMAMYGYHNEGYLPPTLFHGLPMENEMITICT